MKKRNVYLLFCVLILNVIFLSKSAYCVTVRIGDVDNFGFTDISSLVGADGESVDRNNNGILDSSDLFPDLDEDGMVDQRSSDHFDNRSEVEINDINGSKWTDVVLLNPNSVSVGPGSADNAEFIFNFTVPSEDSSDYGKDHYLSFVYADYDVEPMYAVVEGKKLTLLGNNDGGVDGYIWSAYSVVSWDDMLDGEVKIGIVAPNEPYVAFDYALLDTEPIYACDCSDSDGDGVIDQ